MSTRSPRDFFRPLAIGAPDPLRTIPRSPTRMLHFFNPANARMTEKVESQVDTLDVVVGNLEDGVAVEDKVRARERLVETFSRLQDTSAQRWVRVNALDSPWIIDDLVGLMAGAGPALDVVMIPKVEGVDDIAFVDRMLALLEAKHSLSRPVQIHAILETARGVSRVEEICLSSPRLQGLSLGPADLAADREMSTTRVGGGHPGYVVRSDQTGHSDARTSAQQDPWHYTLGRMVDACRAAEIQPYYGPFGDFSDPQACEDQFRAAFIMGCQGAWTLHPSQVEIARAVFAPDATEVSWARRVQAAMGQSSGAVMVDGKMQDDATYKQAENMLRLARQLVQRDPDLASLYGEQAPSAVLDQDRDDEG